MKFLFKTYLLITLKVIIFSENIESHVIENNDKSTSLFKRVISLKPETEYENNADITYDKRDNDIITEIPLINILPSIVVDMVHLLRSLTPFQIIKLAQHINAGQLPPKMLNIVATFKSLNAAQIKIINSRINLSLLPNKVQDALEFLVNLKPEHIKILTELKKPTESFLSNYLFNNDLRVVKVPAMMEETNYYNTDALKLFSILHAYSIEQVELVIQLRDLGCLPLNILDHLNILKSLSKNDLNQIIFSNDIIALPEDVLNTLEMFKELKPEQVDLLTKIKDSDSSFSDLIYALSCLSLVTPEPLEVLTNQLSFGYIPNVLDFLNKIKQLSNLQVNNIKKLVDTDILPNTILTAIEFLVKLNDSDIEKLVQDYHLDILLPRNLYEIIPANVMNLIDVLKVFSMDQINELFQMIKSGLMPSKLLNIIGILQSLSLEQFQILNQQKNLGSLPINVLDSLDYLKLLDIKYYRKIYQIATDLNSSFIENLSDMTDEPKEFLQESRVLIGLANPFSNLINTSRTYMNTNSKTSLSIEDGCEVLTNVITITTITYKRQSDNEICSPLVDTSRFSLIEESVMNEN